MLHLIGESSESAAAGVGIEVLTGVLETRATFLPGGLQRLSALLLGFTQLLFYILCNLCRPLTV